MSVLVMHMPQAVHFASELLDWTGKHRTVVYGRSYHSKVVWVYNSIGDWEWRLLWLRLSIGDWGGSAGDCYGWDYGLVIENDNRYGRKSDWILRTQPLWSKNRLVMKNDNSNDWKYRMAIDIRMWITKVENIDWQIENWKGLETSWR